MRGANPLKEILDKVVKFHGSSLKEAGLFLAVTLDHTEERRERELFGLGTKGVERE